MSTMCVFFMRGTCRFGNRCWNSHDLNTGRSPVSPSDLYLSSEESEDSFPEHYSRESTPEPLPESSSSRAQPQVVSESVPKSQKDQTGSSQPLWSLTNSSSGEIKEGTPDSMLVETVKKLNEAENLVKTLRQQLRLKDESENFSWIEHQIEQCVENDLQCNICYELFIKPTVLNCSHAFCYDCIETWTRRVNHCPTCRVYIKSKAHCLALDSFLDKITECLPEEIKTRRESLKVERNNNREANRSRRNQPRRRNRTQSMRRTLGVLWGERDRDGAEWNISLEEALIDPIRLGDVLGRNRNDRSDDWDENLSDSSLDSNSGLHPGYRFCSYCDNVGHTASNCPLFIMEDDYGQLW